MQELLNQIRAKLVEIEGKINEGQHELARTLLRSTEFGDLMMDLDDKLAESMDRVRSEAQQASAILAEKGGELRDFVGQMVGEIHGGVQTLEQAISRVMNKHGVEHVDARALVANELARTNLAKLDQREQKADRTQAEIDKENAATGEREAEIAALVERCVLRAYAANSAYCEAIKEPVLPIEVVHDSIANGVRFLIANPDVTSEQQHQNWLAQAVADGWTYGPVKDAQAKTHPCLVAYADLPPEQQKKDQIFREAVLAELAKSGTANSDVNVVRGIETAKSEPV